MDVAEAAIEPTPSAVPPIETTVCTTFATVLTRSDSTRPVCTMPPIMPPMLHPSEMAMMERLRMSEAASLAFSLPSESSIDFAMASVILSIAPVSLRISEVTATTAPAIANAAAAPPVTTVVTIAAATATMAPIHPKMRLTRRDFAASSIFFIDSSIFSLRSLCSVSSESLFTSMRSLAISACFSSFSSWR